MVWPASGSIAGQDWSAVQALSAASHIYRHCGYVRSVAILGTGGLGVSAVARGSEGAEESEGSS